MANKITGSTDASGALSTSVKAPRSVLLVGKNGTGSTAVANTIYNIFGTADAEKLFGTDSPLIEMTKILISGGVSFIKAVSAGTTAPETLVASYTSALSASMADKTIKGILLDNNTSTVVAILGTHLSAAEQEDMHRYAVVGCAKAASTNTDLTTLAGTLNNKRIFIAGPNVVDENNIEKDGIYTATALMTAIMTETADPALPMNGVELVGYYGTSRVLLGAERTALINAGVTPLYSENGKPVVYRLVTTKTKEGETPDVIWQEGTTVFIADDVLESVMTRLRTNYKRTKNVTRILNSIKTDVVDVLQTKNDLEIIQNFDKSIVSVVKDPTDLYGALVDYEFKVVTPLYTITIKQHMTL